jgi:acyl carrier protein
MQPATVRAQIPDDEGEIRAVVHRWLRDNFVLGTRAPVVADDQSLVDAQLLDSTGVLELVAFLEQRFGIAIADEEMQADNLDSVAGIGRLILRHRVAAS